MFRKESSLQSSEDIVNPVAELMPLSVRHEASSRQCVTRRTGRLNECSIIILNVRSIIEQF